MSFFKLKKVKAGFSQKSDANMRIFIDNIKKETEKNRELFFKKEKINYSSIVLAQLIHESKVVEVKTKDKGKIIRGADALISQAKDVTLALTAADCLIIYFYDPLNQVIALVHAGWRGLVKNIIIKTVDKLKEKYKSQGNKLKVYISPHIQSCHFEVKEDVLNRFKKQYLKHINKKDKVITVNLAEVAKEQLIQSGLLIKNIQISHDCTYCLKNKYFSYRRNNNQSLETMIAYISLNNY